VLRGLCDSALRDANCWEMFHLKVRVSNRLGLPKAIVKAVENDGYNPGVSDYTITGLLKPPRMGQLMKSAEVVEDAADRIFALQGQVMHSILERAGDALRHEGYIVERRFYKDYLVDGKTFRVAAQIDIFNPAIGTLSDYKYTSVAASRYGLKEDHKLQLNVQAELLRSGFFLSHMGDASRGEEPEKIFARYKVDHAEVVLLMRDWSAEKCFEGYPTSPASKQIVGFMSSAEVDAWIVERIRLHEAAKVDLPLCSDEERWNRPTFALIKPGGKRAVKVEETRAELEAYIAENPKKAEGCVIEARAGVDVRCLRYCPARSICKQALEKFPELASLSLGELEDGYVKL
jgi:hypothetical protein